MVVSVVFISLSLTSNIFFSLYSTRLVKPSLLSHAQRKILAHNKIRQDRSPKNAGQMNNGTETKCTTKYYASDKHQSLENLT
jgi:hypothetical protein